MRTEAAEAVRAFLDGHPTEDTTGKYNTESLLEAFFRAIATKYKWDRVGEGEAMLDLLLMAESGGKKLAWGKMAVIGTQDVSTGLDTVYYAVGVLRSDVSLDGMWVSILDNSNGSIAISVWKPTSSADCTPIPCTMGKTVSWFAIGK